MWEQKAFGQPQSDCTPCERLLATVRKLALPVLQVNIAKKQVNVAGPCLPVDGAKEAV